MLCARCHTASAAKPKDFPAGRSGRSLGRRSVRDLPQPAQPGDRMRDTSASAGRREVRNEHQPASFSGPFARRGRGLEVRAGRDSRRLAQLQDERTLVGHADRYSQVHWLRQLRARLPDGKRCARWILPHLGGALPRHGHAHDEPRSDFARRRQGRISGCRRGREASTSSFPRCATTARIRPARRCARWAQPLSAPTAWC